MARAERILDARAILHLHLKVVIEETTEQTKNDHIAARVSVRVSPGPYLTAISLLLLIALFLLYLELFAAAAALAVGSVVSVFVFAATDRVVFDGKRIRRTGVLPRIGYRMFGLRDRLKLTDIEQVDSQSVRGIRRSGRFPYRHRTTFRGKGIAMTVVSGGERYRKFVREVLGRLDPNVLDARSLELREYLSDPATIDRLIEQFRIPSAEVLEPSFKKWKAARNSDVLPGEGSGQEFSQKARELRDLGNRLRFSGSLIQAAEAFRRALRLDPRDGWVLFDLGRCLLSVAGYERDSKLHRRAVALMRLAERRAGEDGELLSRLGEAYFQVGDWKRANTAFRRAIDVLGDGFRAIRGLAEIALREGKIAHVIHNFGAANRSAENAALRRWAGTEADYFSRLNADDEYMELEVSRVNLLERLERNSRVAVRASFVGLLVLFGGLVFEQGMVANFGWAIIFIAVGLRLVLLIGRKMMTNRIPFELVERDREE